jgi:hypothetical protein
MDLNKLADGKKVFLRLRPHPGQLFIQLPEENYDIFMLLYRLPEVLSFIFPFPLEVNKKLLVATTISGT